jgi:hypothetical protein
MTVFDFRWFWVVLGAVAAWMGWGRSALAAGMTRAIERHPAKWHAGLAFGFLGIASLAKYLQFSANLLHAFDFWLFVDCLEQAARGAPWLTRFAPQGEGWVQHGGVHAFIPLFAFVPLVYLIGAKATALLINPVALALGGWFVGRMTVAEWGARGSVAWMLGFFALSSNGKTLMYETHPEALYPALVLGALYFVKQSQGRSVWTALAALALVASFSLKLDSIGLLLPVLYLIWRNHAVRDWTKTAGICAMFGLILQGTALAAWSKGWLGPEKWIGGDVLLPGVGGAGGWAGVGAFFVNLPGQLLVTTKFLFSRPLLSLVLPVGWVLFSGVWWVGALGLGLIYSFVPGALPLWNYYSAPWVALAFAVAIWNGQRWSENRKNRALLWLVLTSTLLGSGAPRWNFLTQESRSNSELRRREVESVLECLKLRAPHPKNPERGFVGGVAPGLLADVWEVNPNLIFGQFDGRVTRHFMEMDFFLIEEGVTPTAEVSVHFSLATVAECGVGKQVTLWLRR